LYTWEIKISNRDVDMVDAVATLCMLEKEFPLTFMDIMSHLMIHLVEELYMWTNSLPLNVSNGEIHENFEGICENICMTRSEYSRRVCNVRDFRILYRVLAAISRNVLLSLG